jgi:hypothetical protein
VYGTSSGFKWRRWAPDKQGSWEYTEKVLVDRKGREYKMSDKTLD